MTKKKYLHIVPDNKFIGEFIEDLSLVTNLDEHLFVAFTRYRHFDECFTYLDPALVTYARPGSEAFVALVGPVDAYQKIVIHWFLPLLEDFVSGIPKGPEVCWCFWGEFEASFGPLSRQLLFDHHSRVYKAVADILFRLTTTDRVLAPWLAQWLRRFLSNIQGTRRWFARLKSLRRFDALLHWNDIDFRVLQRLGLSSRASHRQFFYNVIDTKASEQSAYVDSLWARHGLAQETVVMVGHSAFPSGNHLGALELLSQNADDGSIRVLAVMSYGDPIYREVVAERGRQLFGSRFLLVQEWLPIEEYYYLTSKVSAALLNHRYSEGAGNIFNLVMNGKKVFLNSKSTVFKMLKRDGVAVFDIEADLSAESLSKLSEGSIERNTAYIRDRFSTQKSRQHLADIFAARDPW